MNSLEPHGTAPSRRRTAIFGMVFGGATLAVVLTQGFLLTPMYLKHMQPAVYGAWLAAGNILAWVELVDPGVSALLQQRVAMALGRRDQTALGTTVGTGLALVLVFSCLPLVALPLAPHVAGWVHVPEATIELARAFRLGVLALALSLLAYGVGAVNVGMQKVVATGALSLVGSLCAIAVTITALKSGWGVSAIPLGLVIRFCVVLAGNVVLVGAAFARREIGPIAAGKDEARQFARLASYTSVARLGTVALGRVDGFLTATLVNPASATVLALTTRAFEIVKFGSDRVAASCSAPLSHLAGEAGIRPMRRVFDDLAVLVACVAGIGIGAVVAFNRPFVALWVGSQLYGGAAVSLAAGIGVVGAVMGTLTTAVLFSVGGVRSGSWLPLVEAAVRVPLQYGLLQCVGIAGVPIATVLTSGTMLALAYPRATRVVLHHPDYRRVAFKACGLACLLIVPGVATNVFIAEASGAWSWGELLGSASLYCALLCSVVALVSPRVRAMVAAALPRRTSVTRPATDRPDRPGASSEV
jgi:O-antigen/teichoic acid export membrane protein